MDVKLGAGYPAVYINYHDAAAAVPSAE